MQRHMVEKASFLSELLKGIQAYSETEIGPGLNKRDNNYHYPVKVVMQRFMRPLDFLAY